MGSVTRSATRWAIRSGGLHGVFALMVAIRERERTGRGQWIELAQVESLIPFVTDAMLDYQFTGKLPPARGNRHREHAPHGIYRCAGRRQLDRARVRDRR